MHAGWGSGQATHMLFRQAPCSLWTKDQLTVWYRLRRGSMASIASRPVRVSRKFDARCAFLSPPQAPIQVRTDFLYIVPLFNEAVQLFAVQSPEARNLTVIPLTMPLKRDCMEMLYRPTSVPEGAQWECLGLSGPPATMLQHTLLHTVNSCCYTACVSPHHQHCQRATSSMRVVQVRMNASATRNTTRWHACTPLLLPHAGESEDAWLMDVSTVSADLPSNQTYVMEEFNYTWPTIADAPATSPAPAPVPVPMTAPGGASDMAGMTMQVATDDAEGYPTVRQGQGGERYGEAAQGREFEPLGVSV